MPTKKSSTAAKIVDVAHPDSVKADATSIPIIVKHGPMLKDPMMAEGKPAEKSETKKEENSPVVTKIQLKPVSADDNDAKPAKKEEKPAEPVAKPEPEPEPEPETSPEEPQPEEAAAAEEPADGEELLPGAVPTDPAAAKAAREAAEKQLALDKLEADGTYFLPITTAEKRKARTFLVALLVVIVLGAAGFLAALDAGYVHIDGFTAPTDFIKN
jgi:outer membrane biosynthesis protein TonB